MSERSKTQPGDAVCEWTDEFLLAATLEPVKIGDEFSRVPPHITILPPLRMNPAERRVFDERYADVAEENLPFTIHTQEIERFDFGKDTRARVLPVLGLGNFDFIFAHAFAIPENMGLSFDDSFSFQRYNSRDVGGSLAVGGPGESIDTVGGFPVKKTNRPHITDFEGLIGVGESREVNAVQLFCYQSFKKVVSIYKKDGLESV